MKIFLIYSTIFTLLPYGLAWSTVINIPADYPTIQQGIDVSIDGDTVLVHPGSYVENINFNGHNIVLSSLFLTTGDTSYISQTIIDGDSSGTVIILNSGENANSVIEGFTVRNGYAQNGGGIYCGDGSSPRILHNRIAGNIADDNGGGVYCIENSNPEISGNLIENNYTDNTLYGYGGAGIHLLNSDPHIENNIFRWNSAGSGGAVFCDNSSPIISSNEFFENNTHSGLDNKGGGAIFCNHNSGAVISNNSFTGNSATGWSRGGAIFCVENSDILVYENEFTGNDADKGGAIACLLTTCRIINNNIHDNTGSGGIGIHTDVAPVMILANKIYNNSGEGGAGILVELDGPTIAFNQIYNNASNFEWPGGIFAFGVWNPPTIINNVFYNNYCLYGPDEIQINYHEEPLMINNIVRGTGIVISHSDSLTKFNNIQGGWPGEGNIDVDPLFRDTANGDFHLMSTACGDPFDSPCIDAGDPSIADDSLDCMLGLGTSVSDMGSYGGGCSYIPGDVNNSGAANGLDVMYLVSYLKGGNPPPKSCGCFIHGMLYVSSDANGSCSVNGLDVTYMVSYFKGGSALLYCEDCPPGSW